MLFPRKRADTLTRANISRLIESDKKIAAECTVDYVPRTPEAIAAHFICTHSGRPVYESRHVRRAARLS